MLAAILLDMMVPLNDEMRSQGGSNRAKNQDPEERKFQAMIAASRRPLLHDAITTPEALLAAFKELAESRPWFTVVIVGANRAKIARSSDAEMLRKVEKAGGAIGFLGITMLGSRVQTYYKPLRRGLKVIEDLDRVAREVTAEVLVQLAKVEL